MKGKIALEEHFAIEETLGDSQKFFVPDMWRTKRAQLLDITGERLRKMDACGIEYSIISLNAPAIQAIADPKRAVEVARIANDTLAELIARHPERFGAFAALPLQDPDAATKELTRCVTEMGFNGALVNGFSNLHNDETAKYYDADEYNDFWGEVSKLDVPFYLHPRNPLLSQQLGIKDHPWLMGPAWSFSVETGVHALRLIGSGLFDKYPNINIILGHLGELIQNNIWRTSHWASANGRNPLGVKAEKPFIDYFRKNFYLTTSGNFRTITMRNSIDEIGSDRVLFSSDYPFEDMEEAAEWFDHAEIGDNDREKIGRENAYKLFKLDL